MYNCIFRMQISVSRHTFTTTDVISPHSMGSNPKGDMRLYLAVLLAAAPVGSVRYNGGMDCGYLGGAVIFTFVLALALGVFGFRTGNLSMIASAVLGFSLVLGVRFAVC